MTYWEGIEDASSVPDRVWLSRRKRVVEANDDNAMPTTTTPTEPWKPLRKCDCQALNAAEPETTVFIESGRCTADPVNNVVFFNFFKGYQRELTSAIWFVKEETSTTKKDAAVLHPVSHVQDSEKIEALYGKAVAATSSLGQGIASVLNHDEVTLSDNSKVKVVKSGDRLMMRKIPSGWFSSSQLLQRGYGEYTIEGEEDEQLLGPVRHCVFVVHGIGEAMFSRESVSVPDLIEMTNVTRTILQKRQVKQWRQQCEQAKAKRQPLPKPPNRIEFLPIQWFNRLHDSSSELMRSLKAVTLTSIPALRAIANDIVFDVLLYLTPAFCQAVIEEVTDQINDLHRSFRKVHPNFVAEGGQFSLVGHSLGSVIVWDILSILKEAKDERARRSADSSSDNMSSSSSSSFLGMTLNEQEVGYHKYAKTEHANEAQYGTWGPSLVKPIQETIPFTPKSTVFLGSPLGMFLTLRGAHAVFDEMRLQQSPEPETSPFCLPTGTLYNIFNSSDPVAYRLEPLLLSQTKPLEEVPAPQFLTAPGKDVRLHVKARQLGDEIRKSLMTPPTTGAFGSLLESAVSVLSTAQDGSSTAVSGGGRDAAPLTFKLGGTNNPRVDYSIQPGVIDNEYISAVLAHSGSTYFLNEDLLDFMMDQYAFSAR